MAMRGRGGRGNNSNRQPRLIVNRVYEQFKPMSEWRQEDDYTTLLVYLPGFQREYIKVTTEPLNTVRVRGERLVSENKWSRFQEDYRVPENCEMRGIRAKLDGGILTITMPRKITNAPAQPLPTPTTATPQVATKTEEQLARRTKQEEPKEKKPDNPQTTRLENTLPPRPPPNNTSTPVTAKTEEQPVKKTKLEEPKEKKPDKPQTTTQVATKTEEQPVKRTMWDVLKEKKPEKPQTTPLENTLPLSRKSESSSSPTKQQPPNSAPQAKEAEKFTTRTLPRGGLEHDVVEKPIVGEKMDLDRGKEKETTFEEETKRDFEGSKGKQNSAGVASGGFRADLKQVIVRGIVNEDRKLLVNVGVGVLIIAALGVHVSYTMGLIGKGK